MGRNAWLLGTVTFFALAFVLFVTPMIADTKGGFENSIALFDEPTELNPSESIDFLFTVYNLGTGDEDWIYKVALTMPSVDYVVNENTISTPDLLHEDANDFWDFAFNPTTQTITWEISGTTTATLIGDIRGGEELQFGYTAQTDAAATDGFQWTLYGDKGGKISGTAWIESDDDDDDSDDDDDDDSMPGSDSDGGDDDSACCG